MATINNVLSVDEMHLQNTPKENTPSRILISLEQQLATLQLKGGNFSETRENIAVKAFNYPPTTFRSPLLFAKLTPSANDSYVDGNGKSVDIFYDPNEVPENEIDTSIRLPPEVAERFLNRRNSKYNVSGSIPGIGCLSRF